MFICSVLQIHNTKYKFCSTNTQSVSSLSSDPFSYLAPLPQLSGSSETSLTLVSHTPFLSAVLLAKFSLIWTFNIEGVAFSLHVTYILHTSSHLTNSSQTCSNGTGSWSPKHRELVLFLAGSASYTKRKLVLACQVFWCNDLAAESPSLVAPVACRDTNSSMTALSNFISQY